MVSLARFQFEGVRVGITVQWVGVEGHVTINGRSLFKRCESTRSDCRARPSYLASFIGGKGGHLHKAMLCRHHAEGVRHAGR